jgi:soluble lytic murein transglycosylase
MIAPKNNALPRPSRPFRKFQTIVFAVMALQQTSSWAADEDFLAALQAAQRQDQDSLMRYDSIMQQSSLAIYPAYWQLNLNLADQSPDTIKAFARRFPLAAMTEKLLADYAEAQARLGRYDAVRQIASEITNPDFSEQCAVAQAQVAGGDQLVLSTMRDLVWLKTEKLPELCQTVAAQLLKSPLMSSANKQQRLWTLLRVGQSVGAAQVALDLGVNLTPEQLSQVIKNPDAQVMVPVQSLEDQALFLLALAQIAERSSTEAYTLLQTHLKDLPVDVQRYAYRVLAMSTTGKRVVSDGFDLRTVDWFDASVGYPWSDEEAESYARHAVRMGAWESVLRALDSMTFDTQQKREWQYWFARASEQRSDQKAKEIAKVFYQSLASETDYYGLLSRDRLGIKTVSLGLSYQPTTEDRRRMEQDIHFKRAFALRQIGADASWSTREWNWAVRQAYLKHDDGMILAAAERADRMNWYDRAIYATERTEKLYSPILRFPTPYREQVLSYSQQVNLDPAWAYGLMRQESRFVTNARSHVGASGLMQIMPNTARWIAGRLGETYSVNTANQMDTNIRYGTFYLSHILRQLSDQPVLATAGYNAGPTRAKRWQPINQSLSADQYTEAIPFLETRDYVKNVMTNAIHYGVLLGQGAQSISTRMGTIPVQGSQTIIGP